LLSRFFNKGNLDLMSFFYLNGTYQSAAIHFFDAIAGGLFPLVFFARDRAWLQKREVMETLMQSSLNLQPHSHCYAHARAASSAVLLVCAAAALGGCTAVPLGRMRPIVAPPNSTCDAGNVRLFDGESSSELHYVLPDGMPTGRFSVQTVTNFEQYHERVRSILRDRIPAGLQEHKVTNALADFLTSVSAEAQLQAQASRGRLDSRTLANEQESIRKRSAPLKLTHREMKDFSDKLFDLSLKISSASLTGLPTDHPASIDKQDHGTARPPLDKTLVAYLSAYYKGRFTDRLSVVSPKPNISTTIPDSEIAAAETVLLEFVMDTIDPTPVMGDDPVSSVSSTTHFYPGDSTEEPTAFATGLTKYVQIPNPTSATDPSVCGITTKNSWVLKDLANGAGDQATAVGGLIANTPGGVSLGLGIIGKISIGDNQTLSTLVKTAASRVATRAALASTYWTLRNVKFNVPDPSPK
jgi:hypothetical protein